MSLQVTVNHEDLVAAWMRAGSLSHLFMVLLDVLLQTKSEKNTYLKSLIHLYSVDDAFRIYPFLLTVLTITSKLDQLTRKQLDHRLTAECESSDLQTVRSSVDSCAALIWTLVDVWQLLSEKKSSNYITINLS